MPTMDINNASLWLTDNQGSEYTVTVPFEHPHFPQRALTVLMVCEKRAFTPEDRDYAQQCLDALPLRLACIFSRIVYLLGFSEALESLAAKVTPTMILEAGDHKRWTFAMDTVPPASSLFFELESSRIVEEWIAV